MDPGLEKDFVGVDIANSGNNALIEEQGLDATAPSAKKLEENRPVNF